MELRNMHVKVKTVFVVLFLSTSVLVAFPEPADIHVDIERVIEDARNTGSDQNVTNADLNKVDDDHSAG